MSERKRDKVRERILKRFRKFPSVNGTDLLESVENLPKQLAQKVKETLADSKPWVIRQSYKELSDQEIALARQLRAAGIHFRQLEPLLRLKGMRGMNAYRAIKGPQATKKASKKTKKAAANPSR